ncbi:hypothetical protein IIA28_11905, partial [candidate division KSB1 bacterium]|nr:hypothetical protein [candidate division KSB1 bacterium]
MAPSFSFKSGNTRGHKGVGATFLAYGFNYIQISTKTADLEAVGKMVDARNWLDDESPAGNPRVIPDKEGPKDTLFSGFYSGASIYLKFDSSTNPSDLDWIKANTADKWFKILSIKTGLGSFSENKRIQTKIKVIDKNGNETCHENRGTEYLWPHKIVRKANQLKLIIKKEKELYQKKGKDFRLPTSMTKLDAIHDKLGVEDLKSFLNLEDGEHAIIDKYNPVVYICYMYSAKVWPTFNEKMGVRQNLSILTSGIQVATNNMPQGEMLQIPLRRNIGRQNQVHCVFHFDNCKADLGRKGFQKDIIDFCSSISRKLIEGPFQKLRYTLRPVTGVLDDLSREAAVDNWKEEMDKHEQEHPL